MNRKTKRGRHRKCESTALSFFIHTVVVITVSHSKLFLSPATDISFSIIALLVRVSPVDSDNTQWINLIDWEAVRTSRGEHIERHYSRVNQLPFLGIY